MNVHAAVVASKPPFRAEHIGSLLRPAELLRERARFSRGEIGQTELTAAEDAGPLIQASDAASHVVVPQVEAASAGPCPGVTNDPDAAVSQGTFECCMTALTCQSWSGRSKASSSLRCSSLGFMVKRATPLETSADPANPRPRRPGPKRH